MKVKLIGYKAKVRYKFDSFYYSMHWHVDDIDGMRKYLDEHEEVVIWEGDMDVNSPEKVARIYVEEVGKAYEISKAAVNTDGGVVYWTKEVVEEIVDDATEVTLEKARARERKAEFEKIQKIAERRIDEQHEMEAELISPKKWYQFWK